MDRSEACSKFESSRLVRLLVERTGIGVADPFSAIEYHVEMLRQAVGNVGVVSDFGPYLKLRKVKLLPSGELACDGYIEPHGRSYSEGFTMLVKKNQPQSRVRFTIAHEICHTFFYEIVPELKFVSHQTDPAEERLCNIGAAALLMPNDDVVRATRKVTPSMVVLEQLAERYGVSLEAMFLRLRRLAHWKCELLIWHRTDDGRFLLDRAYRRRKENWNWDDSSIPQDAWEGKGALTGRTFVHFQDSREVWFARCVYFQVKRRANSLVALWSQQPLDQTMKRSLPLLGSLEQYSRGTHSRTPRCQSRAKGGRRERRTIETTPSVQIGVMSSMPRLT